MKIMYKPSSNGKTAASVYNQLKALKKTKPDYYTGIVICTSQTDKLSPISYGTLYNVVKGKMAIDNGETIGNIKSIEHLCQLTGIHFDEVKGFKGKSELYFTGFIFCTSSKDPRIFIPGYLYSVINGIVNIPGYTNAIPKNGQEFIRELEKDFPAKFVFVPHTSD